MLSQFISKRKIDQMNFSTLADDIVFTLGNYLKNKKIDKEIISLGIDLCEVILRGKQVLPKQMKIEEVLDYETYKLIEKNSETLKTRGLELDTLICKAKEIKAELTDIIKELKLGNEKIKEIQNFFITISLLFWNKTLQCSNEGVEIEG